MRLRAGGGKRPIISPKAEFLTLALIMAGLLVPGLGTEWVKSATSREDLSDLVPLQSSVGGYFLLNWSTLLREDPHAQSGQPPSLSGAPVQALGYMVASDGGLGGEERLVQDFILMPEAGNWMHPAHRYGDQMIAVHLQENARVQFSPRALVWVWGSLQSLSGDAGGIKPVYVLEQARAHAADKAEIGRYFR